MPDSIEQKTVRLLLEGKMQSSTFQEESTIGETHICRVRDIGIMVLLEKFDCSIILGVSGILFWATTYIYMSCKGSHFETLGSIELI
jgi:hypothetical protein